MLGIFTTADFYPKQRGKRAGTLDINRVVDGHRSRIISFAVETKKQARELAARYGARPRNF
jgi:hypothetical protein